MHLLRFTPLISPPLWPFAPTISGACAPLPFYIPRVSLRPTYDQSSTHHPFWLPHFSDVIFLCNSTQPRDRLLQRRLLFPYASSSHSVSSIWDHFPLPLFSWRALPVYWRSTLSSDMKHTRFQSRGPISSQWWQAGSGLIPFLPKINILPWSCHSMLALGCSALCGLNYASSLR